MTPLGPRSSPRLARKARLKWDAREQKDLLLYPERGLLLNATGSAIVRLLDGQRTVAAIVDHLRSSLGADAAEIELEVLRFLSRLQERGVVEVST